MSEAPESSIESVSGSPQPNRLRRALAWVGIVAGSVVIIAAIFVAGAATGWHPAWHDQHHQVVSMPRPSAPPMAGDKCCCEKMAKKPGA